MFGRSAFVELKSGLVDLSQGSIDLSQQLSPTLKFKMTHCVPPRGFVTLDEGSHFDS